MRQRLLLVAGWVLAAVGTSVVASAAVAATGGQVTDRALRPLTAAEVAALPGGFLEVLSESLASGDSSNRDLVEPGESTTIGPTTQPPAGAEGGTAFPAPPPQFTLPPVPDDPADEPDIEEPDPVVLDEAPVIDTHIEHVPAGSVSLVGSAEEIRLLWATPRVGWQVDVESPGPALMLVTFTDGVTIWTISAEIVDDMIEVTTEQLAQGPR